MPYAIGPLFCLCWLSVCNVSVLWPNGWMDEEDETWHGGRPRYRPHCVWWEPSSPKWSTAPQFSVHVCWGQTAGWIKMPLGSEIDLGSGHIVLNGYTQLPPSTKGAQQPPSFRPMSIVAKRSPISATAELLSGLLLTPLYTGCQYQELSGFHCVCRLQLPTMIFW